MTNASAKPDWEAEPGLRVSDLSFRYGDRPVFEQVSFAIPAGEIWGLVGRSGIGKTTLLNIVLGLYRPTTGEVTVGGAPILAPGAVRGAVFRDNSLLPWLSIIDNVLFPSMAEAGEGSRNRAVALLSEAGLAASLGHLPKKLSAGMVKRVEIIRALVLDERYFVADEPFAGLDVLTRLDLHRIWMRLNRANPRTGILCTHDPAEAVALCDAVLVMRDRGDGVAMVEVVRTALRGDPAAEGLIGLTDPNVRTLVEMMG